MRWTSKLGGGGVGAHRWSVVLGFLCGGERALLRQLGLLCYSKCRSMGVPAGFADSRARDPPVVSRIGKTVWSGRGLTTLSMHSTQDLCSIPWYLLVSHLF